MIEELEIALIAFGSNENSVFGDPAETVLKAMKIVAGISISNPVFSDFYCTPAFPKGAGPDFVNAALAITTTDTPNAILAKLHEVEAMAGRTRKVRWGQRTLDLDLIAVGERILPDQKTYTHWRELPSEEQQSAAPDQLILPHPRMQDRSFVLVPLSDVAPHWLHPVLQMTVTKMRDALPAKDLAEVTWRGAA
ncbi:2-amino-4-hydroxy-6-hydroxymethyldihydropteridine diphosphokinase [Loktanella sp. D2R18]|uniref:2-amino-4-hydroxy-6- hydroxymethyldihydropteridine diphosphokinase n=1 Tax=Rhodobacterales TaxID=204455 RepID=UPI000DEB91B5|nr:MULTISPECIES: 2-amino-4-hydroxy-6-hydroxymethyldihydropteridine diphosphokinase [Rhodobacterales]MDO6591319.1 2-amino-4-hydroxy-6-hydroxymethyldihydropteridine diphosphokinase [Yoonia sp. 1_MG-2023]RBW46269.1 2-amino-4-hydroxy-6-hydroxymethyldihydropteridine diphosphokinase [Loktanella sp. D2R18]